MNLDTLAFSCYSHRWAVAHAAGVEPLTCPPLRWGAPAKPCAAGPGAPHLHPDTYFDPGRLADHDLLYFALHGFPDQPYWYGDDYLTALSVDAFDGLDLRSTVVFVACCHFTEGPFLEAIQACKPKMIIGGGGQNFARRYALVGPHLLGYLFRNAYQTGLTAEASFALAKQGVKMRARAAPKLRHHKTDLEDQAANKDALRFKAYRPGRSPFT